jgi:hypothetical protein
MKNAKTNRRKAGFITAFAAILSLMVIQLAASLPTAASALSDADLSAEERFVSGFVNDLGKFDKKSLELSKKASLPRQEFDAHQRDGENLKNRLSGVQNALREVIRKLKAAGQWDNLDAIALTKCSTPAFQDFVRRDGFKRTLDAVAANLSGDASEISKPLDLLRNRIQSRASETVFAPQPQTLAARSLRVAFRPEPAVVGAGLRCRLASVRFGIAGFVHGATPKANTALANYNCQCFGSSCETQ